jgi:hypothetical protein
VTFIKEEIFGEDASIPKTLLLVEISTQELVVELYKTVIIGGQIGLGSHNFVVLL